jgi:membrane protein DedA with SNARE-associated domain
MVVTMAGTPFTDVAGRLLDSPAWVVLLLVAAIVFAEDALFFGFVLPGETAAVLGGVAASLGHVSVLAVMAVVVVAAIVGDSVGYEVGRRFGSRIIRSRIFERRRHQLDRAAAFLARRGGMAVLIGRWSAFLRAVVPALAGTAHMPYPKFLAWNASGGAVWGVVVVAAGYLAGNSYEQAVRWLGRGAAIAVVVIVVLALIAWRIREHLHHRATDSV